MLKKITYITTFVFILTAQNIYSMNNQHQEDLIEEKQKIAKKELNFYKNLGLSIGIVTSLTLFQYRYKENLSKEDFLLFSLSLSGSLFFPYLSMPKEKILHNDKFNTLKNSTIFLSYLNGSLITILSLFAFLNYNDQTSSYPKYISVGGPTIGAIGSALWLRKIIKDNIKKLP